MGGRDHRRAAGPRASTARMILGKSLMRENLVVSFGGWEGRCPNAVHGYHCVSQASMDLILSRECEAILRGPERGSAMTRGSSADIGTEAHTFVERAAR